MHGILMVQNNVRIDSKNALIYCELLAIAMRQLKYIYVMHRDLL